MPRAADTVPCATSVCPALLLLLPPPSPPLLAIHHVRRPRVLFGKVLLRHRFFLFLLWPQVLLRMTFIDSLILSGFSFFPFLLFSQHLRRRYVRAGVAY